MTASTLLLTITTGFFIFVIGQSFLKLVIEPAQELKKSIGLVSSTLLFHQAMIANAKANQEIAEAIRFCSADIVSKSYVVLGYKVIQHLFRLPSKSNILLAAQELNLIAYGMVSGYAHSSTSITSGESPDRGIYNLASINNIRKLLNIRTSYSH